MPLTQVQAGMLASGVPTRAQLPAGSVLQVVHAQSGTFASTTSIIPIDNTIPQNTEGTEFLTASITPTSATSILLITVTSFFGTSPGNWLLAALFQDSIVNALATAVTYMPTNTAGATTSLAYSMTAGSTNATTFKLRYGPGTAGTCYINGSTVGFANGTLRTTITITEIAA